MNKYKDYKQLNLPEITERITNKWKVENTFEESIKVREGKESFVFFEGPPSANGLPGIHHVMGRAIKDIFCRFKTLQGFQVQRKAGWDTHGLPVELGVEAELGIKKEDIGKTITVDEYNDACKKAVMRYTDIWNDLTQKMGYWVDMEDPYITYKSKYIESVWWLLNNLFEKDLIYKGYSIQPYSPAAGTGLSSHELNQPGCYRDVKDTTVVAQFKVSESSISTLENLIGEDIHGQLHFLAWTTTPWTLPSNTALAVGPKIDYVAVKSFNQYTFEPITVIVAKALVSKHFNPKNVELQLSDYNPGDKNIPFEIVGEFKGKNLHGLRYEQLLPYAQPKEKPENAFQVIVGDFVSTEDGTGIVHLAPTFGADDALVAAKWDVPPMLVEDNEGNAVPLVDLQGKFTSHMGKWAGLYVKNEYYEDGQAPDKSLDVLIAIELKEQNKAFKVEKYEHSYPHCWRTDKPVLYYPLDSWFVRSTAAKTRMQELNATINWKPEATGTGRFGNWLENLNDWNLSRSRFWGIPIPIWSTEDGNEHICIDSVVKLKTEAEKAVKVGLMSTNPLAKFDVSDMSDANYDSIDLHKNYMDEIVLVSSKGDPMYRQQDLIDVWFDSGSMPYAQWHYPFENKELIDNQENYPADFIAEGVDQTRGWFYTLHAIATMCFDSVAYKNVVSNGLVLDKKGQKMSKRLGNAVDPFTTLAKYGPDATRWYMITNAQPWDNLKFDTDGIAEVQRKFFGTLHNTYSFFSLYANIDNFSYAEADIPFAERPEIDRWIISKLNSLNVAVENAYDSYEPTKAGRLIQEFVNDHLSNWYVRLCRRRFWKGEYSQDKISAYQTLYKCLESTAIFCAPIAPFYAESLFQDLNAVTNRFNDKSIHHVLWPETNKTEIDSDLEQKMEIAQRVSSLVLSIRKKEKLKVRQPLQKVLVPVLSKTFESQLLTIKELILSEVNVKELDVIAEDSDILVKSIKPNFKTIGPKYGKQMKSIAALVKSWGKEDISNVEKTGGWNGEIEGVQVALDMNDFEIAAQDIPGWTISTDGKITVALDTTLTESLKEEGVARELVNKIQNLRKDSNLEVTDKINISILKHDQINAAITNNKSYICSETLALDLQLVDATNAHMELKVEIDKDVETFVGIEKL